MYTRSKHKTARRTGRKRNEMGTLIVKVTAECENLVGSLPRGNGWILEAEEYAEDGSGTITISFDDDDLSGVAERALDTNPEVVSYRVV
jgi:hypothetical protein